MSLKKIPIEEASKQRRIFESYTVPIPWLVKDVENKVEPEQPSRSQITAFTRFGAGNAR